MKSNNIVRLLEIFVLAGTISYLSALYQGYNNCLNGTGQQKPLLLQDGRRCVQVQPEGLKNWADAMNLCNSKKGHLLHIYSSDEVQLIHDWLLQLPLSTQSWIGSKKMGLLNNNFTGYNIRWMTSVATDIGIDQIYQYVPTDWEAPAGNPKVEGNIGGCIFSFGVANEPLFGVGSFCPDTVFHVTCQFLLDDRLASIYSGNVGKRSLAPIYESSDQKTNIGCGLVCAENAWCLGFNAIKNGSKVTCQFISIKQKDTQLGMTQDSNANYYERTKG